MLGLLLLATIATADDPVSCQLGGVERIKQITNYCGPACLASVMRFYGKSITQETIGREVYDAASGATNGADMLYYAGRRVSTRIPGTRTSRTPNVSYWPESQ